MPMTAHFLRLALRDVPDDAPIRVIVYDNDGDAHVAMGSYTSGGLVAGFLNIVGDERNE